MRMIEPFKNLLLDTNSQNILVNTIELGIDSILEDGLLKDMPFVGSILSALKFGKNVHDRNLIEQTMVFIKEFNENIESDSTKEYIEDYKREINENPRKAEKELGRVIVILNRNIDKIKTRILSKLYLSYIEKNFDWSKFCDLSEVNEKIFTADIDVLKDIYLNNSDFDEYKLHNYQRLVSTGLLKNDTKFDSSTGLTGIILAADSEESTKMELTLLGSEFAKIVSDL